MSIFTTDHPLTLQPSVFTTRTHPLLAFVCSVIALAFVFTPLILGSLYFYFTSNIGAESQPFPDPWFDLAIGSLFSFGIGLVCAALVVTSYRFLARVRSQRQAPLPGQQTAQAN